MNSLDQPFILPGRHTRRCDRLKEIPAGALRAALTVLPLRINGHHAV